MNESDDPKLALGRYNAVLSSLLYENTTYWTRFNFFLTAHAALLGFISHRIGLHLNLRRAILVLLASALGFTLAVAWWRMAKLSARWIEHWHAAIKPLESAALGVCAYRGTENLSGIKRASCCVIQLFMVAWAMLILYSLIAALLSSRLGGLCSPR